MPLITFVPACFPELIWSVTAETATFADLEQLANKTRRRHPFLLIANKVEAERLQFLPIANEVEADRLRFLCIIYILDPKLGLSGSDWIPLCSTSSMNSFAMMEKGSPRSSGGLGAGYTAASEIVGSGICGCLTLVEWWTCSADSLHI